MRITTPRDITSDSIKLLKAKIGVDGDVISIPIVPERGEEINDCHRIVLKKVVSHGGEVVHGWLIWELPHIYLEGVFHSVWKTPSGNLVDLTPQQDGETKIAFLPDNRMSWGGVPVPTHRLGLQKSKLMELTIAIAEATEKLQIQRFIENGGPSTILVKDYYNVAKRLTGPNDPCMCESGVKYKKCCKLVSLDEAMKRWVRVARLPFKKVPGI